MLSINVDLPDGDHMTIQAAATDSVDVVRREIVKRTGDKWFLPVLRYNGEVLWDDFAVEEYNLYNGCTVHWREGQWIWVETAVGRVVCLQITPHTTVGDVKRMIQKKGINTDGQILRYGDQELQDEKTLRECDVGWRDARLWLSAKAQASSLSSWHKKLFHGMVKLNKKQTKLEAKVKANHQEVGEKCEQLAEADEKLAGKMADIALDLETLDYRVKALEDQTPAGIQPKQHQTTSNGGSNIKEKFTKNYTAFFAVDLDIADALLQAEVLSYDKYDEMFDRNTGLTRNDRIREMLREVMKTEGNIRAFRQALLCQGDMKSQELAELLQ